jgi:peptide methionine sulfoxide reductase MsrB
MHSITRDTHWGRLKVLKIHKDKVRTVRDEGLSLDRTALCCRLITSHLRHLEARFL